MRFLLGCLLAVVLCFGAGAAFGAPIPISGSVLDAPQSQWAVDLSGPGFSVSTDYFIPFSRPIGAPHVGELGTIALSVGMSDYESPADGTPSDSGSLNGVSGIVEGEIDFQVTYDPSPLNNPTSYAGTITGIPVMLTGDLAGYTCSPALPDGCLPGTELWTVSVSGAGDATITQSSGGMVESVEVSDILGIAGPGDPPVPAGEPSAIPFMAFALLTVFLLRKRYAGAE